MILQRTFVSAFVNLLDKLTCEIPANYYARFKWVVKAASRDSYFRVNPTEGIPAISNPSVSLKEHLEAEEYIALTTADSVMDKVINGASFSEKNNSQAHERFPYTKP